MDNDAAKGLGDFFDYIWHDTQGYVYLPVIEQGNLRQYTFAWPRQKKAVIDHVLKHNAEGADAYYSPALYKRPRPLRENVLGTHVLWADFDGNAPDTWEGITDVPEPTLRVQSSLPGKQHVYWSLDEFVTDTSVIDERNRAITYALGADKSGWDANQFLRPPFTTNTGYGKEQEPAPVKVVGARQGLVSLSQLESLPSPKEHVQAKINLDDVPRIEDVIALNTWSKDFWELFNTERNNVEDRSSAMTRAAYFAAEHSFSDESIYAVLDYLDKKWGKYVDRLDRQKRLVDIIGYVREKIGYNFADNSILSGLIEGLNPDNVEKNVQVVYGFQDFLDAEFHIEWLIEGLMPVQGFGILSGNPGVGKTQIGIQLGCALALGEEFVGWNVNGKHKVLFASLEMSREPLHHFMSLIAEEYTDPQQRLTLQKNFNIMPIGEGIPFDREEGQKFIDNIMAQHMPDVLFIDSLQKVVSKELTDELAIRGFTEYLKKHIRHKYNCAVYIIHHNRKGQGDHRSTVTLDDLHGSRFLSAELDFALNFAKLQKNIIQVDQTKNRLAEERDRFLLQRNKHLNFSITESLTEGRHVPNGAVRIGYDTEAGSDDGESSGSGNPFALN